MGHIGQLVWVTLTLQVIGSARGLCFNDINCICGGTLALELKCNIDGQHVEINLLPDTYINIKCTNVTNLDYAKLPICANRTDTFKSVSFKDCPLPASSFKEVLTKIGVTKTMALIFQNTKNLSGYFDRKHFAGLQNLTKLLLSINGNTQLPNNLFMDINELTWLNIRSNGIHLSEELFKPLERLETLEISHNHMTNISSSLFSHLSYLRKLSLWQSNVTWFSEDFFNGVDVLEELDLSSNGLNKLPATIFKPLKKLKKLTLFSNKFSTFPKDLFKGNDELETVIILNNDVVLRSLPGNLFGSLPSLKQIYLQRCGLENIPDNVFVNSSQLRNISLAYNDIRKLPEAIFNDQINLLELDLSHNKLEALEPKIFSSLVRLNRLDLGHNCLVKLTEPTFSPLFSVMYLNLEYNKIREVEENIFSHSRNKMVLSFAYNELSFECDHHGRFSPFNKTFNLGSFNLSHNNFKKTFKDWWVNGHDIVDVSFNNISFLRGNEKQRERFEFPKPMKEMWISHNTLECNCVNNEFIAFMMEQLGAKVPDMDYVGCPFWTYGTCDQRELILTVTYIVTAICVLIFLLTWLLRWISDKFYFKIKELLYKLAKKELQKFGVTVEYAECDEEYVFKEIVPELKLCFGLELQPDVTINALSKQVFLKFIKPEETTITFVVFSQNYLLSHYSFVDIKMIRGNMMKRKHTIYIFGKCGMGNSLYAFLREERNRQTSLVWLEPNYWNTIQKLVIKNNKKPKKFGLINILDKIRASPNLKTRNPNVYAMNTVTLRQV